MKKVSEIGLALKRKIGWYTWRLKCSRGPLLSYVSYLFRECSRKFRALVYERSVHCLILRCPQNEISKISKQSPNFARTGLERNASTASAANFGHIRNSFFCESYVVLSMNQDTRAKQLCKYYLLPTVCSPTKRVALWMPTRTVHQNRIVTAVHVWSTSATNVALKD